MTIRQIPDSLEEKIKALASQSGLSINKTVLHLLNKSLGLSDTGKVKRDVSALAGTWNKKDEKEFEKNMSVFNTIDEEVWKKQ